ncbi:MAG: S-adenosylmethionine:tRNA ribosyltransferase-isomerase [Actinomycetota bacterium]|nr:S-adenosylmethionine:tRNA ribosyltransferase-isomerase [Actinomycetota bacterium]
MSASGTTLVSLDFELPDRLIATAPVEAGGGRRDDARLLVSWRSDERLVHTTFAHVGDHLRAGDVVVVNTSATLPAAVPTEDELLVHLSTELPGGRWLVEVRRPCGAGSLPHGEGVAGRRLDLPRGASVPLLERFPGTGSGPARLWIAALSLPPRRPGGVAGDLGCYLSGAGRPIRYGCADRVWPLADYQTVFALHPGSAEMPSAGRAFTTDLVTSLVARGVAVAPVLLHTGVSSQEAGEAPYAERYQVPVATAALVNAARHANRRVLAVGTTVTRALESAAGPDGSVRPAQGWTELVISPDRGVRVVDALLTGWHEPRASHLALLEAVAGRALLERSYAAALAEGYRWHEFGDLHLVLP